MSLQLDLDSLTEDLDLSDLHILLEQDSSGDEEDDLDLESSFPTVIQTEVEETIVPIEQVRRIVDLRDYDPGAEIDVENPEDIQQS